MSRIKDDETGWRVLYTPRPGKPGNPSLGFELRAGPDANLKLAGPLVELDARGIILRRDNPKAPAFAVGSPLQPVTAVVMDCIRKATDAKPQSSTGILTLSELVFGSRGCMRIQLEPAKTDGGAVIDPNVARLYLPTTRPFVGIPLEDISTSWDLTYVPHGKTPSDGYDLHVRPMLYGHTGVRSYLLTEGKIYATWENRRATPSDPAPEPCERDFNLACNN